MGMARLTEHLPNMAKGLSSVPSTTYQGGAEPHGKSNTQQGDSFSYTRI